MSEDDEISAYTPPIVVTYKRLKYECDDSGLTRGRVPFQADLSDSLPILLKNGKIHKGKSREQRQQRPEWWRAQCTLRGLDASGSIDDVQNRLRNGPNVLLPELAELERQSKADWMLRNAANQKKAEQQHKDKAEAARAAGMERLNAIFSNASTHLAVIKQNQDDIDVAAAAKEMGLHFRWTKGPGEDSVWVEPEYWFVVGRSMDGVNAKCATIQQEKDDRVLVQRLKQEEEEKAARASEAMVQAAVAEESARGGDWDVTGLWQITSPDLEEQRSPGGEPMQLKIYWQSGAKVAQFFAQLSLAWYDGWLRFEDPTASPPAVTCERKRKRAWDAFLIPLDTKPSPTYPTWTFRWRGRETCGNEGLACDDEWQCSITFSGTGGCTLSGTFAGDGCSKSKFTGVKVGMIGSLPAKSIDQEWENLFDSEYHPW
jgi:hypothetical protein